MKKIKVCIIITRLIRGGAAIVALAMARGLEEQGYEVTLVTGPQDSEGVTLINEAVEMGLKVIVADNLVRDLTPKLEHKALFELFNILRHGKFDLVHTHTSKAGIMGRIAARLARVPVIVHSPHGHIYGNNAGIPGVSNHPARRRFYWHIEKFANSFTDSVVMLTERERIEQVKLGLGPYLKFTSIHNGINPEPFINARDARMVTRQELGIPEDSFVAGMVGRLTSEKGHSVFLDAALKISQKIRNANFLIVGEGPLMEDLKIKAAQLGINRISFLGMRADIPQVLSAMDMLVLPSLYEGLGLVALEAMAAGLPVVGNNVGGIPEVVIHGKTGFLVEPGDPGELAESVIGLAEKPALASELGRNGRARVLENFTERHMKDKLDMLYRQLLKRKGII